MDQVVTYLLMIQKFTNLRRKILIFLWVQYLLENISKDWLVDNMERVGFTGDVYDFSVDYYPIAIDDIKDIQKYLMEKYNTV